jgi:dihydrofolate synthase/folylpolyglutamate synthase
MTYDEAISYLEALVDHERLGFRRHMASEVSLDTMRALAVLIGEPHLGLRFVHIAGSKGKGSVAAMVEAIARAAGYRTGLYTSPHLVSPRERIRVNGEPISEEDLAAAVEAVRPAIEELRECGQFTPSTFFEAYTAMAMLHFARSRVELVVWEAGLGGRLDATNIVWPTVCAITTICREHTDILGSSLEQIASEKAGIIKPGVPVILADMLPEPLSVLEAQAKKVGAPVIRPPHTWAVECPIIGPDDDARGQIIETSGPPLARYELGLLGQHQVNNAAVAIAIAQVLCEQSFNICNRDVAEGLRGVRWPGRLHIAGKRPRIILDCAHTPDAARALVAALKRYFSYRNAIVVLGMSEDKDAAGFAFALAHLEPRVILCQAKLPRALSPEALKQRAGDFWASATEIADVRAAIEAALSEAHPEDLVCITGSAYVVGEAMEYLGIDAW